MAEQYLRARKAMSVETAPGIHRTLEPGEVVSSYDVAPHVLERYNEGEPWLANLFEDAEKEDYDGVPLRGPASDAHTRQIAALEKVTQERAAGPLEERVGESPSTVGLMVGDEHRTLPVSGADLETDVKFAEGEADTSEAVDEAKGEAEDLTEVEQTAAVSELPRAGDPPSEEEAEDGDENPAPKRRSRRKAEPEPEPEPEA